MIELKNWTLCAGGNDFMAPEHRPLVAGGEVDSHPRLGDCSGKGQITTSRIVYAKGNVVRTQNSTYVLVGPPCDFFRESVLQKHGLTFNGDIGPIVAHLNGG